MILSPQFCLVSRVKTVFIFVQKILLNSQTQPFYLNVGAKIFFYIPVIDRMVDGSGMLFDRF